MVGLAAVRILNLRAFLEVDLVELGTLISKRYGLAVVHGVLGISL